MIDGSFNGATGHTILITTLGSVASYRKHTHLVFSDAIPRLGAVFRHPHWSQGALLDSSCPHHPFWPVDNSHTENTGAPPSMYVPQPG